MKYGIYAVVSAELPSNYRLGERNVFPSGGELVLELGQKLELGTDVYDLDNLIIESTGERIALRSMGRLLRCRKDGDYTAHKADQALEFSGRFVKDQKEEAAAGVIFPSDQYTGWVHIQPKGGYISSAQRF